MRSRTCSSTPAGATRSACRRRAQTRAARRGPAAPTAGRTIPLRDFFVAKPSDSASAIDQRGSSRGKHLLLTPGVYDIGRSPLRQAGPARSSSASVTRRSPPSMVRSRSRSAMSPAPSWPASRSTPAPRGRRCSCRSASAEATVTPTSVDPTPRYFNMYFRVGGPHVGSVDTALEVTQPARPDRPHLGLARRPRRRGPHRGHGALEHEHAVATASSSTATTSRRLGLFVEHFQQYNTIWNGDRGVTVLYQNELPYDPPSQADWMHDGVEGWAGYKVGNRDEDAQKLLRRRRVRLRPEQPIDPHGERLRGPADARCSAAPRHDRQSQRGHHRPRGQRCGRSRRREQDRRARLYVTDYP